MAEAKKTVVTAVQMEDGRTVEFAGKRRIDKTVLIDQSKIELDGDTLIVNAGAVSLRMDFVEGQTRTFVLPLSLLAQAAGHGLSQKYGDELASPADKPLTCEDMVVAVEALDATIQKGSWRAEREGGAGAVSGASIVIRALVEASGKTVEAVKAFLQGKLDAAEAKGEKLSRKELYDSFKKRGTKTGEIIARMEQERLEATAKVNADESLAELAAV